MTRKILSGVYSDGYILSANYDRLSVTQSAQVTGAAGAPGLYGFRYGRPGGSGETGLTVTVESGAGVKNAGTIIGGVGGVGGGTFFSMPGAGGEGGEGVVLAGAADFANHGGTIDGGAGGEGGQRGGDPHSSPGSSGPGGAAVFIYQGARLDNVAGTITGGAGGALQVGAGAYNGADGGDGVLLAGRGAVSNAGVITGGVGGAGFSFAYGGRTGGAGGAALAADANDTIYNKGSLVGGTGGAGGAGFDPNTSGGAGGAGGAGALLTYGVTLTNFGLIAGGAGGAGGDGGEQPGGPGAQGVGVMLEGYAILTNGSAGHASAQIIGAVGVESDWSTVVNFGTIDGTGGVAVQLSTAVDRLVVEAGSTFVGAVVGGGGTLELAKASGTITGLAGGQGSVTGGEALSFSDFGGFVIDQGGTWTLSGVLTEAIDNAGLIESSGQNATVKGAVSGSGSAVIATGTLNFASTFSQNVRFATGAGSLELADSVGYGGTISGFSTGGGTQLDLVDIAFGRKSTDASFAGNVDGGVLTVTDGTHTAQIKLKGDYVGDTFAVSSDKQGGTLVTATLAGAPSVHAFASAMAGMNRAGAAGFATRAAHDGYERAPMMLAHPVA
jgi:hypothetical protein